MNRARGRTARAGSWTLTIVALQVVIGLGGTGLIVVSSTEGADAALFGRIGTLLFLATGALTGLAATAVLLRGGSRHARIVLHVMLIATALAAVAVAIGFLVAGGAVGGTGCLTGLAAAALLLLGREIQLAGLRER